MFFLRQGATHKVTIGPAVAVGDGFVPVTNLDISASDEAEAILHDNGTVVDINGYTFDAIATADGYYHLTLHADITGTVGHLTIIINDDSLILPLRADFTILEEVVYDALYKAAAVGFGTIAKQNTAQTDLDTLTDASGEPGQGAPPVSATLIQKIGYLYKNWRNKGTQTTTEHDLFADDASTVDQKATVSDAGGTFTKGEIESGP